MTREHDDRPESLGHDRRAFLQRVGIGAVAASAWVAPQVLFTDVASAGCTPLYKMLQLNAGSCAQVAPTGVNGSLPGCLPANWATGRTDGVPFVCVPHPTPTRGATITVNLAGCGPSSATAVKYCPSFTGTNYTCIPGTIVGNTVTFPTIGVVEDFFGCAYIDYRITVKCCT